MANVSDVMGMGSITDENYPTCNDCKITHEEMTKEGKPFLMVIDGVLICGKCVMKRATPVMCGCGHRCKQADKFCNQCGQCLKPEGE